MVGHHWTLEFPYRRSTGPVVGGFLTALRERSIVGARTASGRVLVPALEYDPDTGDPIEELVPVGDAGTVTSWVWVSEPKRHQPLDHPFAWATIRLDGADTDLVHVVDSGNEEAMSDGMRVAARWIDEPEGLMTDIAAFEPAGGGT